MKKVILSMLASLTLIGISNAQTVFLHNFDTTINVAAFTVDTYEDSPVGSGTGAGTISGSDSNYIYWTSASPIATNGNMELELRIDLTAKNFTGGNLAIQLWTASDFSSFDEVLFSFDAMTVAAGVETFTVGLGGAYANVYGFQIVPNSLAPGNTWTATLDSVALVPEPSTFALLGLGAAALYILRRKQK